MPRAAVLGSPIAHSLSPALHQAAYRYLGLDWEYSAIDCTESEFPEFFESLDDQWRGLSLTMPLKEVVLGVVDQVDHLARTVRSANTVFRSGPSGSWRAANTDIAGMENALREIGVGQVESVRVLGGGATARSAVAAVARLGCTSVVVHARRAEAARSVADIAIELGLRATTADLDPVPLQCDLLVSTLPTDVAEPWAAQVRSIAGSTEDFGYDTALLDASYHPWPTPLAQAWLERAGVRVANGRDMLVWQAVDQVRLMTGMDFDDATMVARMRSAL